MNSPHLLIVSTELIRSFEACQTINSFVGQAVWTGMARDVLWTVPVTHALLSSDRSPVASQSSFVTHVWSSSHKCYVANLEFLANYCIHFAAQAQQFVLLWMLPGRLRPLDSSAGCRAVRSRGAMPSKWAGQCFCNQNTRRLLSKNEGENLRKLHYIVPPWKPWSICPGNRGTGLLTYHVFEAISDVCAALSVVSIHSGSSQVPC